MSVRSYYGRPVLKEPVWKPEVALYFWLGGLAGASALLGFGSRVIGEHRLARSAFLTAFGSVLACPPMLIADLGRPERFTNMLRVLKPTSPMSVGSWALTGFGGAVGTAVLSDRLDILRPLGRASEVAAALLGLPLTTYTAVLVSDTSIPAWHEARRHLPFVFAGGAAASAGAAAAALVPPKRSRPARRVAVFGSLVELTAAAAMERSVGVHGQHYRTGPARAARWLTGAGALLMAAGGRSRPLAAAAGAMILGGSLAQRFAVLRAGPSSARATAEGPTVTALPDELGRPARARSMR